MLLVDVHDVQATGYFLALNRVVLARVLVLY
jgi:hypothetical protein